MTLSDYESIKKQIKIGIGSSQRHIQFLNSLKDRFKEDINSARRLEQVTTGGQLLNVLELRDTLSEDNVAPLKEIAKGLSNSPELLRKIEDYEAAHVPREYTNYYVSETPLNNFTIRKSALQYVNTDSFGDIMSLKKRELIYETITKHIGNFWTELARNLRIPEAIIDDLDYTNNDSTWKTEQVLKYFAKRSDPQKWFFDLCDALDNSKRRDMSKSLKSIIQMNI